MHGVAALKWREVVRTSNGRSDQEMDGEIKRRWGAVELESSPNGKRWRGDSEKMLRKVGNGV